MRQGAWSGSAWGLWIVAGVLSALSATPATAALPPLSFARGQLAEARRDTPRRRKSAPRLDVTLSRTDTPSVRHTASAAQVIPGQPLALKAQGAADAKTPDLTLTTEHKDLAVRLAAIVALSPEPITPLATLAGGLKEDTRAVDLHQEGFVVTYGDPAARVELSQELRQLRTVTLTHEGKRWQVLTRGTIPQTHLPRSILVTCDGAPKLTLMFTVASPPAPLPETRRGVTRPRKSKQGLKGGGR